MISVLFTQNINSYYLNFYRKIIQILYTPIISAFLKYCFHLQICNVFRIIATPKNCEECEIPATQIPYKIHGMDLLFNKWIYLLLESMNFTPLYREEKSFIFQNRIFQIWWLISNMEGKLLCAICRTELLKLPE